MSRVGFHLKILIVSASNLGPAPTKSLFFSMDIPPLQEFAGQEITYVQFFMITPSQLSRFTNWNLILNFSVWTSTRLIPTAPSFSALEALISTLMWVLNLPHSTSTSVMTGLTNIDFQRERVTRRPAASATMLAVLMAKMMCLISTHSQWSSSWSFSS